MLPLASFPEIVIFSASAFVEAAQLTTAAFVPRFVPLMSTPAASVEIATVAPAESDEPADGEPATASESMVIFVTELLCPGAARSITFPPASLAVSAMTPRAEVGTPASPAAVPSHDEGVVAESPEVVIDPPNSAA